MRMLTFAKRTTKEIIRDPLNLAFGLGFPLVLICLLSAIQANIPVSLFEIDHLTPGIAVFGLSFMTLFSATIIAKDRGSSLLQRLYTTPLTAADFILGYTLPMIPIAMGQTVICYLAASVLGLEVTVNILYAVLMIAPVSLLYISLGLLCGSVLNDKQVVPSKRSPMRYPLSTGWNWAGQCFAVILPGFFPICGGCWDMQRFVLLRRSCCFCAK